MPDSNDLARLYPFYPALDIEGARPPQSDALLCAALERLLKLTSLEAPLYDWVHLVKYRFEDIPQGGLTSRRLVKLRPANLTEWTIVHELAHAWDAENNWQLSERMRKFTHSGFSIPWLHKKFPDQKRFWYKVGSPPPPCGSDKNFNSVEDFAESLTAYVFPDLARKRASKKNASYEFQGYIHFHDTPRGQFIKNLIEQTITPS